MKRIRRLALQLSLIVALGAGVSCTGDVGGTGPTVDLPDQPSPFVGSPDDPEIEVRLLSCTPQDYLINSQVIGPKGGKIKVGNHVLSIPAGALSAPITIVAEQVTGSTNSVRFGPEGLRFARPAQLTLSYANCLDVPGKKSIAYTSEELRVLELLRSEDKARWKILTTGIDHFSRYAVAY